MEKSIDKSTTQVEKSPDSTKNSINSLKKELDHTNGIMKLTKTFEKSPLFQSQSFKKGEYIFKEGETNNNIYIIKKGVLSVEKYTTSDKTSSKQLATLKTGSFLGEGGITNSIDIKEVSIKALENSEVLKIDAKNDLKKFIEENPVAGYEFLKNIILETNKRLLEANKLIAANYEIEKTINSLKNIDLKAIFSLIDSIKNILDVDYILYFESHKIITNLIQLKYDSRQANKLQDLVFENNGGILDLDEIYEKCNISSDDFTDVSKLSIGDEVFGYIIIGRYKRIFDGSDKKAFSSMANSLAGILKKFLSDKENKDKIYIEEMKNID